MMFRWISLVPADRVLPRREEPVEPPRRVGHRRGRLVEQRVHAEQLAGASATRVPSSEPVSLRIDPSGPGASPRIIRVRFRNRVSFSTSQSIASCARRWRITGSSHGAGRPAAIPWRARPAAPPGRSGSGRRGVALVHQRGRRHLPALVQRPEQVRVGHDHVGEEHLVEVMVPGQQHERAHRDAGRAHRHQEAADALVLGHIGIRPREQDDPVARSARPRSTPSAR